jgi:hypothetical protein
MLTFTLMAAQIFNAAHAIVKENRPPGSFLPSERAEKSFYRCIYMPHNHSFGQALTPPLALGLAMPAASPRAPLFQVF